MTDAAPKLDLDRLVAPVPGGDPTGVPLRYESVYQHIAEARREDDPSLPQGNWERPLKRADWVRVEQLCTEALIAKSKDIQIAGWLTEAWLHRHGLDGLERGLRLIAALGLRYWDALHPRMEDGDIEYRVAPFVWMNDNLPVALRRAVPIVEAPAALVEARFTLADWAEAVRAENLALKDARAAKLAEGAGKATRATFQSAASIGPPGFFRALHQRIGRCDAAVAALEELMQQRLRDDSPGLAHIHAALEEMRSAARELAGHAAAPAPEESEAPPRSVVPAGGMQAASAAAEGSEMTDDRGATNAGGETGPIRSREEAFRRLTEAADYLMRTEPHSPCPYLVKRAIAWGRLPLTDLLQELVRSEADLNELYLLLGMRSGEDEGNK